MGGEGCGGWGGCVVGGEGWGRWGGVWWVGRSVVGGEGCGGWGGGGGFGGGL